MRHESRISPVGQGDTRRLGRGHAGGQASQRISTCVDPNKLDRRFRRQKIRRGFLAALPASVDPCGENGEFHTFANEGPMFREKIPVTVGEIVERDTFVFADLLPGAAAAASS